MHSGERACPASKDLRLVTDSNAVPASEVKQGGSLPLLRQEAQGGQRKLQFVQADALRPQRELSVPARGRRRVALRRDLGQQPALRRIQGQRKEQQH